VERRELLGPDGVPVATYVRAEERDAGPCAAELVPCPGVSPYAVARAAAEQLGGILVSTEVPAVQKALLGAGAQVRRRVELMSVSLAREQADPGVEPPHPPARAPRGVSIVPFHGIVPPELGAVSLAAYPPSHPDHHVSDAAEALVPLRRFVEGGPGWTPLDAARLAVRDADGQAVGAAIIAAFAGEPPRGGPHLAQLFRLPGEELRGLGAALLDTSLVAARLEGCATVGLGVNADNPARRLYLSRGFAPFALSVTVRMPGEPRAGSSGRRRRADP